MTSVRLRQYTAQLTILIVLLAVTTITLAQSESNVAPQNCTPDGLYPVTTTQESDLIQAIADANAETCHPVAIVSLLPNDMYTLTTSNHSSPSTDDSAFPLITGNVIVEANGSTLTTGALGFRLATVDSAGSLTIQDATLRNFSANGSGGIVHNAGTLTIERSTLSDSSSKSDGGMIYSTGAVNIRQSTLKHSSITGAGGLIYATGSVSIEDSTLRNSSSIMASGGAIYSTASLSIANSTFQSNIARVYGGAIYATGSTTITNSSLQNSQSDSGGVIYSTNDLTVTSSTLQDSSSSSAGGLMYATGTTTLDNSTLINASSSANGGMIFSTGALTVRDSSLQESMATGSGGMIHAEGHTTIDNSTFSNSTAGTTGGIIHSTNTLTITGSTLQEADSVRSGGLIHASGTQTTITGSDLRISSSPTGGAIYASGALTLRDSMVSNATSTQTGGGIFVAGSASSFLMERSIIEDNAAGTSGGGIFTLIDPVISESSIQRNVAADGGGLYIDGTGGQTTIEHSLFADNVAEPTRNPSGDPADGGAIYIGDTYLMMLNSTLTRNQSEQGGALFAETAFTTAAINFSTLVDNRHTDATSAGIIGSSEGDSITVRASLFDSPGYRNCLYVQSDNYNISSDSSCVSQQNDLPMAASKLTTLSDNGGPTLTHSPLEMSPAVNRVPSANCTYDHDLDNNTADVLLTRDARGISRPVDAACDSGAVEGNVPIDYDVNNDGIISPSDVITVINAVDTNATAPDVNRDGIVDMRDVELVRNRLGTTP